MASIKYKTEDGYVSIPMSIEAKTNEENGNGIGTCSTSSGTALTVALTGYELVQNGFVAVTFENDVPANATLNINGKGDKPIIYKGSAITADTIKADDTVMFAYDGTNYVVTSLGGETGEDGEIVVVRCSASDDASVAGKTVTINGTQYTLDATGAVSAKVPFGTQYSVVAGVGPGDYITPETQTFTAGVVLREVTLVWVLNNVEVDLGLPSGLKWARKNIDVTQEDGFTASAYQYECSYFSGANVVGHNPSNDTFDYSFNQTNYNSTPGAALTGNIPANSTYDAARANCGEPWRMPTKSEFEELLANCDFINADGTVISSSTTDKSTTVNGIIGVYMQSKINQKRIFFPYVGIGQETNLNNKTQRIMTYTSTKDTTNNARLYIFVSRSDSFSIGSLQQTVGCPIRPVK